MGKIVSINRSSTRGSSRMAEVRDKFDRFDWMRGWLRDDEVDSPITVAVLTALFDHMGKSGKCWPSVATVAELAKCTERTARQHVRIAESLGWVITVRRPGKCSVYQATQPTKQPPSEANSEGAESHAGGEADEGGRELPPYVEREGTPEAEGGTPPAPASAEQTIEQTIEQTKAAAAGGREDDGDEPEEFAGLKNQSMWARKYDLDELPDSERMDPMEFVALWKQSTGERISIFDTKGVGRSARHVLRFFAKDTLVDLIELAADPSTKDPWSYLVGCLKREASGKGAPGEPTITEQEPFCGDINDLMNEKYQ